ncbi:MAG: hydantoinase B/oxoprolinase family protein, partial [Candidatus Tectomicrobia bacterium]|nr:hydantoinase B/oxoprolinase family protein [Candidatus Tectomicrobia bacterium]
MDYDPIKLEIFKNALISIAEEMGAVLRRAAYSPNIKERQDFSCAIFDGQGKMVVQGEHLPVHLGSMPLSVAQVIQDLDLGPDDVAILNDPYRGGTHLPDITMVAPVYVPGEEVPVFFVANRAHHADVGGMTWGSMPLATEIYQEGLIIPPLKLVNRGQLDVGLMKLILANVRTPEEREGDLITQWSSDTLGTRRLLEIVSKYGLTQVREYMKALQQYAERMVRAAIAQLPDGTYCFEDALDDDGIDSGPIKIRVRVSIKHDDVTVDFTGTDTQVKGSLNAVYAVTLSAVAYVFRVLVQDDIPFNAGCMAPLKVIAPRGTVVNASFPAAVVGGNVETSQRIVDVLLGALSQAAPHLIPAASSGTMNNVTIGGFDPIRKAPFSYYETIGGGMGARPNKNGLNGIHTHMTNTLNTPVEALESAYPLRVMAYCLRHNSGGAGVFKGGEGIRREIKFLCEAKVTVLSDRR